MKTTMAIWYMDSAWLKMGTLRNIPLFHKLFNLAYGIRKSEYMAQILMIPAKMSDYQTERRDVIATLLQLQGVH